MVFTKFTCKITIADRLFFEGEIIGIGLFFL